MGHIKTIISTKVAVIHKNKLLLLKRSEKNETNVNEWELPGGKVDSGESLNQGLIRELKEETNIDISEHRLKAKLVAENLSNLEKYEGALFLAFGYKINLEHLPTITLSHEHEQYAWVELNTLATVNIKKFNIIVLKTLKLL
ncbi:MAG: NUDIX hydrolase [Patescibacteria group bacterium]